MHIIKNTGVYNALVAQLDKLARHNRQGSFRTKERYYEAFKRFCAFLADEFHLQTLNKVSGKHLVAYVLFLQERARRPFFCFPVARPRAGRRHRYLSASVKMKGGTDGK